LQNKLVAMCFIKVITHWQHAAVNCHTRHILCQKILAIVLNGVL